jgi:hypothetical protein
MAVTGEEDASQPDMVDKAVVIKGMGEEAAVGVEAAVKVLGEDAVDINKLYHLDSHMVVLSPFGLCYLIIRILTIYLHSHTVSALHHPSFSQKCVHTYAMDFVG